MTAPRDFSPQTIAFDIVESLREGCQVISPAFCYLYVNDALVEQARQSRDQLVGRTMTECFPGIEKTPMLEALQRCMAERTHERMESEFTFPDGSTGWFSLRFVPVPEGVCILSLDVTEARRAEEALRKTEEQLRHAQKMEAVGRLAGSVAHDFNNVLSVVLGYTDLILADLPPDHPVRADLAEVQTAGERATALTRQLLTFSHKSVLPPAILDLDEVLAGMEGMLARLVGPDVTVALVPSRGSGRVRADRGHIEQLVMNLAVNAKDAMPRGGKLTIQTANAYLDLAYAREHLGVTPGPYVMLAVSDTGAGMDKDTQARIFEPFFTTKGRGQGTGLGLAIVFGVVKQSGGHVWVYSEKDRGTTFKIYLPWTAGDAPVTVSQPPASIAPARGSETVLLVEDDDQVRAVARGILQKSGYEVLVASSPGEALLASEQHEGAIHLLLTDVVMPRMTGPELAMRVRSSRPDTRVLFMSGYTDEAVVGHGMLDRDVAFLQKPVTVAGLNQKVREVLDAGV